MVYNNNMPKKKSIKVNNVIKRLVATDFLLDFMGGMIMPIMAVFFLQKIEGATLSMAGLAVSMYWTGRVLTTVPISKLMDRIEGEKDEYWFLVVGSFLFSTLALFYLWADQPIEVYTIQLLLGITGSMIVPSWHIIFTNHLDKGETGYEWSLDDLALGLGTAISAYIGALIADKWGFDVIFVIFAAFGYTRVVFLVPLYKAMNKFSETRKHSKTRYKTAPKRSTSTVRVYST